MATGTHISLPSTPFGQKVLSAFTNLQNSVEQIRQLKSIADAYTVGGTLAANLEDPSGPTIPAGAGQTLYTDLANIKALIDVAGVTTAVSRYLG